MLLSICSLLAEPNPNDPLVPHIAELFKNNRKLHDFNAKEYIELNDDLQHLTETEAKLHYENHGYKENRQYKL